MRRALLSLPLRAQFAAGALTAVLALMVAVLAAVELMFVSPHDAKLIVIVVVGVGTLGLAAAFWFADAVAREVEHERDRAESVRRELVAAASHDLRTPVTNLRLLAEAVDDEIVDGAARRDYVARMGVQIRALGALIDDLFELSRIEAGDISWSLQQVDVGGLVHETVAAMRPLAAESGVAVDADLPAALRPARADPEKIQRVLYNLVQNAIRHTPADGSVVVRARSSTAAIELEVADTGAGFPPAERERAFAPFTRGDDGGARGGDRAGLGLAIARAIVEAHGGRIWIADGPGARVRFSLPAGD